jgi:hypothetical protein
LAITASVCCPLQNVGWLPTFLQPYCGGAALQALYRAEKMDYTMLVFEKKKKQQQQAA